eukprot:SAG31_NODE_1706_length_7491_cov_1.948593_6_plen_124_part_00
MALLCFLLQGDGIQHSLKKITELTRRLKENRLHGTTELRAAYSAFEQKVAIKAEIQKLRKQAKASNEMILRAELKGMKRVLRRLGLLSADYVVEAKGRVCCAAMWPPRLVPIQTQLLVPAGSL